MIYKFLTILFLLILIITLFMWWQDKISKHLVNDIMGGQPNQSNHKCNAGCPVNKFPDGVIPGLAKSNLVSNSSSSTTKHSHQPTFKIICCN